MLLADSIFLKSQKLPYDLDDLLELKLTKYFSKKNVIPKNQISKLNNFGSPK